jgi:hypothetical protein
MVNTLVTDFALVNAVPLVAALVVVTRLIVVTIRTWVRRLRNRRWVRTLRSARPVPQPTAGRADRTPPTATGAAACHEPAAPVVLDNGRTLIKL